MFEGSLGEIIREFRKKTYPKQDVLAKELGYSDTHPGKIESDASVPDPHLLLKLYEKFVPEAERERYAELLPLFLTKWFETMFDHEVKKDRNTKDHKPASEVMVQQAARIIRQLVKQHESRLGQRSSGHLRSLENFPADFLPLTIIAGDRRPRNRAGLATISSNQRPSRI